MKTEQKRAKLVSARKRIIDALVGGKELPLMKPKRNYEERLDAGELEDKEIEIQVQDNPNPTTRR